MESRKDIEQLLKAGETICVKPEGYSMYPMLVPGRDSVMIEPCRVLFTNDFILKRSIRRGDVALYRRDSGILVLHRVFRVKRDEFYMVGDNQTQIEGPLHPGQLQGRMVGFVRRGKHCSVDYPPYRIYVAIWLMLRPFRHKIAEAVHFLKVKL